MKLCRLQISAIFTRTNIFIFPYRVIDAKFVDLFKALNVTVTH